MKDDDEKDSNASLAVVATDLGGASPREGRKVLVTGNLAAMMAIAATAPVERDTYEINAPRITAIDWGFTPSYPRTRCRPIEKHPRTNRERMQKASRKRNRGSR